MTKFMRRCEADEAGKRQELVTALRSFKAYIDRTVVDLEERQTRDTGELLYLFNDKVEALQQEWSGHVQAASRLECACQIEQINRGETIMHGFN